MRSFEGTIVSETTTMNTLVGPSPPVRGPPSTPQRLPYNRPTTPHTHAAAPPPPAATPSPQLTLFQDRQEQARSHHARQPSNESQRHTAARSNVGQPSPSRSQSSLPQVVCKVFMAGVGWGSQVIFT